MELALSSMNSNRKNKKNHPSSALEQIAERLKSGDPDALGALVSKTQKACYHLAYSLLGDADLAKDAVQDAYLVVYQRVGQLRDNSAFKSWLFRIVSHCSHQIQRKRKPEFGSDMENREEAQRPPVGMQAARDPSSLVADCDQLRQVFEQLPEIDRTSLALREICSMSYEEMSRVLRVPLGTVRSRLAKARKRFIATYKEKNNDRV